jgi:hypothetical protein
VLTELDALPLARWTEHADELLDQLGTEVAAVAEDEA